MGTTVSIAVADASSAEAQQAVAAARAEMERIGREWYPWKDDGELVRVNAALAEGRSVAVSAELAALLNRASEFHRQSEGVFDPAIGKLVRLWGFHLAESDTRTPPSVDQLNAWRANRPALADLTVAGNIVRSRRRDVVLDLGAIGKGYAVDRAIDILRAHGVENALVNAGGNVRGIGRKDAGPWRIAIRHPRADEPLGWLELDGGESVSTSGDYERFAIVAARRVHHLIDPRTGEPAVHTQAVTVIAADATTADAASTAIFIAGPEAWRRVARAMGVVHVLRVDATGQIETTRALRDRLHSATGEPRQTAWKVVDL